MAQKRKKRKRRGSPGGGGGGGGSGTMSSMRGGFKSVVGQGKKGKKETTLGKLLSYLLLAAAVAFAAYRLTR